MRKDYRVMDAQRIQVTPERDSFQEKSIRRPLKDRLFQSILLTAVSLLVLVVGIAVFLRPAPVLGEAPWLVPVVDSFVVLVSVSVAFLAFGRYPVLRTPVSYWVGVGFMAFAILIVYRYIFFWPVIMGNMDGYSPASLNVFVWLSLFNATIPLIFLLMSTAAHWPRGRALAGTGLIRSVIAWFAISALAVFVMVRFPEILPTLLDLSRAYISPIVPLWEVVVGLLFIGGAVLSTRRYLRTGDDLSGYVGLVQVVLAFAIVAILLTGPRYSIWWYLQRFLAAGGYLALMFGLLSQYIEGFRRERESEARYRQLADAMPQLVWTAGLDGVVDYYNQRYREYDGIAPRAGGEWQWSPALHPDDVEATQAAWRRAVETGETYQIESRIRAANGEYRWHLSRGVLVYEDDRPVKWFGTATDIDDLKQAETALQLYAAELERSNRDLQEFAFVASHDLQEPLRKIEAFGDAVLDKADNLTERQMEYLTRMRNSADRMRNLVDGLLKFSRLSTHAQPFQSVDVHRVITEVLMDLEMQIEQTGGVVETGELPVIEGDPVQIRSLMQNLIGNALKFQPPGNTPRINVTSRQAEAAAVQILVEDNGVGFDDDYVEQIFQPFKRLVSRREYEGSGIGLAICRKIVERHGGQITAHSENGRGATFIVTLPVRQNEH